MQAGVMHFGDPDALVEMTDAKRRAVLAMHEVQMADPLDMPINRPMTAGDLTAWARRVGILKSKEPEGSQSEMPALASDSPDVEY